MLLMQQTFRENKVGKVQRLVNAHGFMSAKKANKTKIGIHLYICRVFIFDFHLILEKLLGILFQFLLARILLTSSKAWNQLDNTISTASTLHRKSLFN